MNKFWESVLDDTLRPIEKKSDDTSSDTLKKSLKTLRNGTMAGLLVINIIWIILLYTVQFPELRKYNISSRAFEVLFLALYSVIIIIQFGAMIVHRLVQYSDLPHHM